MTPRRTSAKDLRRLAESRPELRTIVVFCEGVASEPDYIRGLKRLEHIRRNAAIKIEIDPGSGVPLTLVERAVDRKRSDDEVDEVWCVFDVEAPQPHPHLDRALVLAQDNGIRLALSNPCFELWLILHFEERTAFMLTKDAESRSRHLEGRSGKRLEPAAYMPHRHIAVQRARSLTERHDRDGTAFPKDNPSSSMYAFLESVDPDVRS
jgi:hypothetical protein